MRAATGFVTAGVDDLLVLRLAAVAGVPSGPALGEKTRDVRVQRRLGLHARPAAALAGAARRFRAEVLVETGTSMASARSIVGLLSLGVVHGEVVRLRATGPDAGKALATLARVLEAVGRERARRRPSRRPRESRRDRERVFTGVPMAPGCAAGPVARLVREEPEVLENGEDERTERRDLDFALEEAKVQLRALEARVGAEAGSEHADIFEAHVALLDDPLLLAEAEHEIVAGKSAAWAFREAVRRYADRISRLPNPALAARAADLRDAGGRVLRILVGQRSSPPSPPEGSIVVAEDLSPSEAATLGRGGVAGLLHGVGRGDVARRAPGPLDGDSRRGGDRRPRARDSRGDARGPRRRRRRAAPLAGRRRARGDPRALRAARGAAERRPPRVGRAGAHDGRREGRRPGERREPRRRGGGDRLRRRGDRAPALRAPLPRPRERPLGRRAGGGLPRRGRGGRARAGRSS